MNEDSNGNLKANAEIVDIMKLSYSTDYKSRFGCKPNCMTSLVQYSSCIAILAMLEMILIVNIEATNLLWAAIAFASIALIFLAGIRIFNGVLKTTSLFFLSSLITLGIVYINK